MFRRHNVERAYSTAAYSRVSPRRARQCLYLVQNYWSKSWQLQNTSLKAFCDLSPIFKNEPITCVDLSSAHMWLLCALASVLFPLFGTTHMKMPSLLRFLSRAKLNVDEKQLKDVQSYLSRKCTLFCNPVFNQIDYLTGNSFIAFWRHIRESIGSIVKRLRVFFRLEYRKPFIHSIFFKHFFRLYTDGICFGQCRWWRRIQQTTGSWWWFLMLRRRFLSFSCGSFTSLSCLLPFYVIHVYRQT